ncbi:MAG: hypothetical protein IPI90_12645 [Saprospiraceae bacterium]|nr:hypothetical protein [Candidatus Vicinibacter affinis]
MHLMAGLIIPTKGKIIYQSNGVAIEDHLWFRHFSLQPLCRSLRLSLGVNGILELYLCHKDLRVIWVLMIFKICFLNHIKKIYQNFFFRNEAARSWHWRC